MKGSSTISAFIILGIISLSSANRIPARLPSCVTYCGNYAKHCVDCPSESCDIDDHDCIFYECMVSMGCHIYQKREKSDAIVETIWGSEDVQNENELNSFNCEGVFKLPRVFPSPSSFTLYDFLMWCNSNICDDKSYVHVRIMLNKKINLLIQKTEKLVRKA